MPISDVKVRSAKPKEKSYKIYDEKGLYLIINPSGGKWWRMDYVFNKKRKTISLGVYPTVSLKEARDKRDEYIELLKQGIDPSEKRKKEELTLSKLMQEWFEIKEKDWVLRHAKTVKERIKNYIEPAFGNKNVSDITTPDIYNFLLSIQDKGFIELAHRIKQILSMAFRYGIVKGIVSIDPTASLGRGMLITSKPNHYPTILEPKKIGALMRAIEGYEYLTVRCALKFLILTFVRPGELRYAEWKEINVEEKIWEIPASKMKMKKDHIVPLSRQAVEVLDSMKKYSGLNNKSSDYVFFSSRYKNRPISNITLNAALRRMGYDTKKDITSHGFRAMARTILHEKLGYAPDIVELQLAHAVPDRLGEAYNRTKFIEERKKMMQDWADYIDSLKVNSGH